ncbi:putative transcriptional regulatory protein, partial [Tolypocladium ophioglossoides CBS 100239]
MAEMAEMAEWQRTILHEPSAIYHSRSATQRVNRTMNRARGTQRIVRPGLKKRRPPLACIQCYRRKIKCGRELPACSRCVKAGHGHECAYRGDSSLPVPNYGDHSPPLGTDEIVSRAPAAGEIGTPLIHSSPAKETGIPRTTPGVGMMHFKGRETSTKFYGFSYHLNFYQQFPDLPPFIAQLKAQNPLIDQLRDDIFSVTSRRPRTHPLSEERADEETLGHLIPQRSVADTLVQTYFDRFEVTHRVLNIPVFMAEYNRHWENPRCTPAASVVQFLLVMATAASIHPEIPMSAAGSNSVHDLARRWIEATEAWITSESITPPESGSALMTHCLLLISKRANYLQESDFWTSTGRLVRWAMAAGYHCEAGPSAPISLFHREVRRRLWTTIIELDLQASIERGMPPSIKRSDFSTRMPLNADDDAMQESTEEVPTCQPLSTWTNTSFQVILHRSFATRLDVCSLVNGPQDQADFDQVLRLGDMLVQALRELPAWHSYHTNPRERRTILYVEAMLRTILNQYILLLHIPWAIKTPTTSTSEISRRARLDAAAAILNYTRRLVEGAIVPEPGCRIGLVLAALNICHELYLNSQCSPPEAPDDMISTIPELAEIFLSMVERALLILEKRVTAKLEGLNEYYVLCMVVGLVKSKLWPQSSAASGKEAVERVVRVSMVIQSSTAIHRVHVSQAGS